MGPRPAVLLAPLFLGLALSGCATPPSAASPGRAAASADASGPDLRSWLDHGTVLPDSLVVPEGARPVGGPKPLVYAGKTVGWTAEFTLASTQRGAALDAMQTQLMAGGWQTQRGADDVFSVRRTADRWEMVRVQITCASGPAPCVLTLVHADRPA